MKDKVDEFYRVAREYTLRLRAEHPSSFCSGEDENPVLTVAQKGNSRFHIIGEHHFSLQLLDLLHTTIVPQIISDHASWFVFKEAARIAKKTDTPPGEYPLEAYLLLDPIGAYLHAVCETHEIPYEDPILSMKSPEVEQIALSRGISSDTITGCKLFFELSAMEDAETATTDPKKLAYLSEILERSAEDVIRLLESELPLLTTEDGEPTKRFWSVISAWNKANEERIKQLVDAYRTKTNGLICVGLGHLEAVISGISPS